MAIKPQRGERSLPGATPQKHNGSQFEPCKGDTETGLNDSKIPPAALAATTQNFNKFYLNP